MKSHGYIVVINNYDDTDIAEYMSLTKDYGARYYICAFEVGTQCGTPHIQGYVYFENSRTRQSVSKMLPRASLHPARATGEKAFRRADYCRKDGDFYEEGIEPTPGRIGKDYLENVMQDPYSHLQAYNQYRRVYNELKNQKSLIRTRRVHYTDSLEEVLDRVPPANTYIARYKDDFRGYRSESIIVMDDQNSKFNVAHWLKGFPSRVVRGYEVLNIDPDELYIVKTNINKD